MPGRGFFVDSIPVSTDGIKSFSTTTTKIANILQRTHRGEDKADKQELELFRNTMRRYVRRFKSVVYR
ncbi:hypothetical protein BACUNI_00036 [Bacteroides uniformis ATCC 8492]|uniref:Uncharacterized protein n=1 Tax=Bacteroides uniformis (strain ATCC 8492 / DSM 6597 / CCUG 4942 / CIP 103695 / JCM 5828 / KCTC 5204 / NCTC 13054 / VPI 0061) TaxID=411479 RepID=A0ABC9NIA7_BACUC|nr:hypothetical protein BACUNI_00036 [Bacteroides uniformis ATCC 8492]